MCVSELSRSFVDPSSVPRTRCASGTGKRHGHRCRDTSPGAGQTCAQQCVPQHWVRHNAQTAHVPAACARYAATLVLPVLHHGPLPGTDSKQSAPAGRHALAAVGARDEVRRHGRYVLPEHVHRPASRPAAARRRLRRMAVGPGCAWQRENSEQQRAVPCSNPGHRTPGMRTDTRGLSCSHREAR